MTGKDGKNERDVNKAITLIFRERYGWESEAEKTQRVIGHSGQRPDVIVKAHGQPVIIETEYPPNSGLEGDVKSRLDKHLYGYGKPASVIGVILPERLVKFDYDDLKREIQKGEDFRYYTISTDGKNTRFPEEGMLTGGLSDLAAIVSLVAIPWERIQKSVDLVYEKIALITKLLSNTDDIIKLKIAKRLGSKPSEQTWNMAGLMLINAGIFYEELSGILKEITPLMSINDGMLPSKTDILKAYSTVLKIDYASIFQESTNTLKELPDKIAASALEVVIDTVSKISALGVTKSGDMYGAIYQNMLDDRKRIAAYYTKPEAAALLTNLLLPSSTDKIWSSKEKLGNIRIVDFACGTGMLLTQAYHHIKHNAHKNIEGLHRVMIEKCFHGYDIFPIATHLTISNLAALAASVDFSDTNIVTMKIGPKKNIKIGVGYDLGSLDLLTRSSKQTYIATSQGGKSRKKKKTISINDNSFDYIVMNPPYTRMTNHTKKHTDPVPLFAVFDTSAEDQKKMAGLLKYTYGKTIADGNAGAASYFVALGDRKLKPGGKLGLVLPGSVPTGTSWKKFRKYMDEKYTNIMVITTESGSFSFGTKIREIILLAEKKKENIIVKKESRIKLIRLNETPKSRLLAVEIGKIIRQSYSKRLESDFGSTELLLGSTVIGSILDCPSDGNGEWSLNSAKNTQLASLANNIMDNTYDKMPITRIEKPANLDDDSTGLGSIKKIHRDIADNRNLVEINPRAPFILKNYSKISKFTSLWKNDHRTQRKLIIEPTNSLDVKPNATKIRVDNRWNTRTCVFINNNSAYNSQRLIAAYTKKKHLGGSAWVNVSLPKKYEKAFVIWCNSTFGIILYWFVSGSQQSGRGRMGVTAFREFPVLNLDQLSEKQIDDLSTLFDEVCHQELKPLNCAADDEIRKKIDSRILEILGMKIPLTDIYNGIKNEPQFGYRDKTSRKLKNNKNNS